MKAPLVVRLALGFCPAAFRREYAAQVIADAKDARWRGAGNALFVAYSLMWSGVLLYAEGICRTFSVAARSLSKSKVYAAVSIAAIALAIATNVSVASVLEGVLLRPLPYPSADRLYSISEHGRYGGWSYLNAREYAARSKTVADLGIAADDSRTFVDHGRAVRLSGKEVDEGYFHVLGNPPELGREIAQDAGKNVAVISDRTWREYFGSTRDILGQRLSLSGTNFTIVGVMPPQFRDPGLGGTAQAAYWLPDDSILRRVRARGDSIAVARLRPNVSPASAQADLRRIVGDLDRRYPNPTLSALGEGSVVPLLSIVAGSVQPLLWMLYAAVTLLLVIACANVANLALVRASTREQDLAVRSAVGANRSQLAAQLFVESALVAAAGCIAGAVLGWTLLRLFDAFGPQLLPRWESVSFDGATISYVAGLIVFTTLVTAILPVLFLRTEIGTAIRESGRSGETGGSNATRRVLLVAEIALATAVVCSASLVARSYLTLTHVDTGIDASMLTDVSDVALPLRSTDFTLRVRAIDRLVSTLASIPGVVDAAASHNAPFTGTSLAIPANVPAASLHSKQIAFNSVTPGYFGVFHIPLLAGRAFTNRDALNARPVAIVSAAFARFYFGGIFRAIGKTVGPEMDIGLKPRGPSVIIGVVGDTRNSFNAPVQPEAYVPVAQFPLAFNFTIRSSAGGVSASAIQRAVAQFDRALPAPTITSYTELMRSDAINAQVAMVLFGAFAFVALGLALAGVYAVTAFSVGHRTHEFGIRKAIGASNGDILRSAFADSLGAAAVGIAVGIVITAAFARPLSAVLFETSPLDPLTLAVVVLVAFSCSTAAAFPPAIHSTRIQPADALRYE